MTFLNGEPGGLLLGKGFAWTIVVGLVSGGIWVGTTVTKLDQTTQELRATLAMMERATSQIDAAQGAEIRAQSDRLRALEITGASTGSTLSGMAADLRDIKTTLGDLVKGRP
jgi:formyltetrahydrofolate synthetase